MSKPKRVNLKKLIAQVTRKMPDLDLDGTVIATKEGEASAINNEGLEAQLAYLAGAHGIQWLEDYLEG